MDPALCGLHALGHHRKVLAKRGGSPGQVTSSNMASQRISSGRLALTVVCRVSVMAL